MLNKYFFKNNLIFSSVIKLLINIHITIVILTFLIMHILYNIILNNKKADTYKIYIYTKLCDCLL